MEPLPLLGIFDSGVGGFTVYKRLKNSTSANCVYYGDCLRAPYGNREASEIVAFIKEDIEFLQEKGVTHFVNACNSMSVLTTDLLLEEVKVNKDKYIDMIRAFDVHSSFNENDRVLVIATVATIRSGVYQEVLKKKNVPFFEYVYKDLANAIENNTSSEKLFMDVEKSVMYACEIGATHIIYGCTHYPIVHRLFLMAQEKHAWKGVFVDPSVYVAKEVKKWGLQGERSFVPYSSKDTAVFIKTVIQFL